MSLDLDLSLDTLIASGAYPNSIMPVCDAIFAWKRKPHAMVEDLFGVKPDPWQRESLHLHLAEIATQVAPGAHAALLVDQAAWHLSGQLIMPPNITLIPSPAKCPELNPQENLWQFMRDNWLSNRIFKSFDDIVDHCCDAWNKLVDQPWRIMSIGLRDWVHAS